MSNGVTIRKFAILACILSILASAIALVGCGGGGSSSQTPEKAAKTFWEAVAKQDADTSWALMAKNVQSYFKNTAGWARTLPAPDPKASVEVGKATITGDTAKVSVNMLSGGNVIYKTNVSLVKEDGIWKVSDMGQGTIQ